jgi:ADP-ribose pyrophosphatase
MSRREIFTGKTIRLSVDTVTLPNRQTVQLELVRHPGASAIVPLRDNGHIILIHQYRYAAGGYLYEVPAGKLTPGEAPDLCAHRELEEESGYRAGRLIALGSIVTVPGFCDEVIHLFLATGLEKTKQALDDDEVISIVDMPFDEAMAKVRDNTIRDAKSICALHAAYHAAKTDKLI